MPTSHNPFSLGLNDRSIHVEETFRFVSVPYSRRERIELGYVYSKLSAQVPNLQFRKARQANSPVKCRDEVDEMTKFEIEGPVGVCGIDEDTN